MKRILHVIDILGLGGIQTFIMSVYRNIDRSAFAFDFLTFREGEPSIENEITALGGKIYRIPGRSGGPDLRRN